MGTLVNITHNIMLFVYVFVLYSVCKRDYCKCSCKPLLYSDCFISWTAFMEGSCLPLLARIVLTCPCLWSLSWLHGCQQNALADDLDCSISVSDPSIYMYSRL